MYSDAQFKHVVRTVTNLEARHQFQKVKRHIADLDNMSSVVWLWQSAHDHVRVANCLHLTTDVAAVADIGGTVVGWRIINAHNRGVGRGDGYQNTASAKV